MKLKLVGFFEELEHGNTECGRLSNIVNRIGNNLKHKSQIINYLDNGVESAVAPIVISDFFKPEISLGTLVTYTDGVWEWPVDYKYYIEKYNIMVPDVFVQHMVNNNWLIHKEIDFDSLEFGEYVLSE